MKDTNIWEFILWLLGKRKRFRVAGNSMLPWLPPGEEILVNLSAYQKFLPQKGDLVVVTHPHHRDLTIVKRVVLVTDTGDFFLMGDNPQESTDSRFFGAVSLKLILGKVTSRFA
jgi:nickel-type superoxide dismutase maturation protease